MKMYLKKFNGLFQKLNLKMKKKPIECILNNYLLQQTPSETIDKKKVEKYNHIICKNAHGI